MSSATVLVVEDDPDVARLFMMMLKMWEFKAVHASGPREALELARSLQAELSLVLCDVNLAGESGPSVAGKIRVKCPGVKTLFTSGSPLDVLCDGGLLTREALGAGDTGYIQKPFMPVNLKAAIENLMKAAPGTPANVWQSGVQYARAAY